MENISRVSSYFWIKLLIFPIITPLFLIYSIYIFLNIYALKKGTKTFLYFEKFKKFYRWWKLSISFKPLEINLHNDDKLIQAPAIYILNNNLRWEYTGALVNLFKNSNLPIVFYFENKKFWHIFLNLYNLIYSNEPKSWKIDNKAIVIGFIKENDPILDHLLKQHLVSIYYVDISTEKLWNKTEIINITFTTPIKGYEILSLQKSLLLQKIFLKKE